MPNPPIDYHDNISPSDFRRLYLATNCPALLGPVSTASWPCRRDWLVTADNTNSSTNSINITSNACDAQEPLSGESDRCGHRPPRQATPPAQPTRQPRALTFASARHLFQQVRHAAAHFIAAQPQQGEQQESLAAEGRQSTGDAAASSSVADANSQQHRAASASVATADFPATTQPTSAAGCTPPFTAITSSNDQSRLPNTQRLASLFLGCPASVATCDVKEFNTQATNSTTIDDFMTEWQHAIDHSLPFNKYLRDFHFCLQLPPSITADDIYNVPPPFCDDCLSPYYLATSDSDYRFMYAGGRGTFTPMHRDVFCSYSWSSNVVGEKLWVIIEPQYVHTLMDRQNTALYDPLGEDIDNERYPLALDTLEHRALIVHQLEGESIFIPSGYYHAVYNIAHTVSVNHNWSNGYTLEQFNEHIRSTLLSTKRGLSGYTSDLDSNADVDCDCIDDNLDADTVQLIMKADCGMDCSDFLQYLLFNAKRVLRTTPSLRSPAESDKDWQQYRAMCINKLIAISKQLPAELDVDRSDSTYLELLQLLSTANTD